MFIFLFVTLGLPPRCSFEGAYFQHVLRHGLWVDLDSVFTFSRKGLPFQQDNRLQFSSPGGATIFAKSRSKIPKTPKIGEKVCAHDFE